MKDYKKIVRKFESVLKKYSNILICIKGSPDPDAISSAYVLKLICEDYGIDSSIISTNILSLPQNIEFVKALKIPIKFGKSFEQINKKNFDSYAVVDHQSPNVNDVTGILPCALHIDHHEISEEEFNVDFSINELEVGSTCTIMTILLRELGIDFEESVFENIATCLLYGIQTDTDKYAHANKTDFEAIKYLSKYSDINLINRISGIPLSKKATGYLTDAIENKFIYKDWLITGIGFLNESDRDIIAIIADFILQRVDTTTIIVFALIEKNDKNFLLDASFRTNDEDVDLNLIIKGITSNGGGRKYKGAYQIDLNYFSHCPDKDLLWEVAMLTTIDVLKKSRDKIYITELKGFYNKIKKRFSDMFTF